LCNIPIGIKNHNEEYQVAGKIELYSDARGEFRFRLKAGNGEVILTGEGYKSRTACDNGVASVQKNAGDASRYERKQANNGKHYFVLKAGNHQVIGQSQMYGDTKSMEAGIKSVMSNGPSAKIDDQVT
jgi:uncharacterized protein YegP (UPF0339 family)